MNILFLSFQIFQMNILQFLEIQLPVKKMIKLQGYFAGIFFFIHSNLN